MDRRFKLPALSSLALLVSALSFSPSLATADILYTVTGSLGDVLTFQLPSLTPTPLACTAHPPDCFAQEPVTVDVNGTNTTGLEIDFPGLSEGGGLTIDKFPGFSTEYVNLVGPLLFTGTLTNPVLLLGTFSFIPDNCCGALFQDPSFRVTVTSVSSSVPEPSPAALTGIVCLFLVVSRKVSSKWSRGAAKSS